MHDHGHGHRHHHGHDHAPENHAPENHDWAFGVGVALNTGFVAAEIIFGLAANSVALLADAMHNLSDVLALLLSWAAAWLARRPPTRSRSYGWGRFSILAALANAVLLLLAVGAIGWEAVQRLRAPEPVVEATIIWVATIGILVNGATAAMFLRGRAADLNIRAAFQHMAADAAVSLGVVIAALLVQWTGKFWIDPLTSLVIVVIITIGTWGLLRQSAALALDAVPDGISLEAVEQRLLALPGVTEVHDLHVWGLSTRDTAMTAHLVCATAPDAGLLPRATHLVRHDFGIRHATFQIETPADAAACQLRPADVV